VLSRALGSILDYGPDLGIHLCLTEVPLDAKVDRQAYRCNCHGAQHQKYKQ
jgi:hypothetical protein